MFVDITITEIKVMGKPKAAVFRISCKPESGEGFEFQFGETLARFDGLTLGEVESYILERTWKIIEEVFDSRQQLVDGEWSAREQLIDKGYRLTLIEEPIEGEDKFTVKRK